MGKSILPSKDISGLTNVYAILILQTRGNKNLVFAFEENKL